MNKKILGNILKVLVILIMLTSLSGCLMDLFSTITVKVNNYQFWSIEVDYRASGETTWQTGVSLVSEDGTKYFDLPAAGDYDFRVRDWVSEGDYVYKLFTDEDCTFDLDEEYDYVISILSSSVSFY